MSRLFPVPISILAVGAVLLAGCGKQEEASTASPPVTVQTPSSAPSGPSGPAAAASNALNSASSAVSNTANSAASKTADSVMTAKVKNALMTSAKKVSWKGINVDTGEGAVHLKGTVPDAQQKANAESIAKETAGSQYKVVNQLEVKGG